MLRDFFEVDAKHIVFATLTALFKEGKIQDKLWRKPLKNSV